LSNSENVIYTNFLGRHHDASSKGSFINDVTRILAISDPFPFPWFTLIINHYLMWWRHLWTIPKSAKNRIIKNVEPRSKKSWTFRDFFSRHQMITTFHHHLLLLLFNSLWPLSCLLYMLSWITQDLQMRYVFQKQMLRVFQSVKINFLLCLKIQ